MREKNIIVLIISILLLLHIPHLVAKDSQEEKSGENQLTEIEINFIHPLRSETIKKTISTDIAHDLLEQCKIYQKSLNTEKIITTLNIEVFSEDEISYDEIKNLYYEQITV